jgi:homoserine acetyltransferase
VRRDRLRSGQLSEQIAFAQAQLQAIRMDPHYAGGDYYGGPLPVAGLGLARRIAHITYRSEPELAARFGRGAQGSESPSGRCGRWTAAGTPSRATSTIRRRSSRQVRRQQLLRPDRGADEP